MTIPVEEFTPPTLEDLEAQALEFFKENKPKLYKEYKKAGELDKLQEICKSRAERTKELAEYLISSGTWAGQAYLQATRQIILESDTD